MDDTGPYQRMLASLRDTFNKRLPAGLTSAADARLRRTVSHYIREVTRMSGVIDEQEILRESFDSMAGWFRRNTAQLSPVFRQGAEPPRPPPADRIEYAVAPDAPMGLSTIGGRPWSDPDRMPMPSPLAIPEFSAIERRSPSPRPLPAVPPPTTMPIVKQEDVAKYRDTEYNLVLNSKDRDWLHAPTTQNRYNFSVQFDSTRPQLSGVTPTLLQKLRNIIRVEFVKAILPVESLRMVIPRVCTDSTQSCSATAQGAFFSVLALPSITVMLEEHQGNNVGTNNDIDRSLAICQYDATWRTDGGHSGPINMNRGYAAFIPKFMKAQRVYAPTPLANFQRLSFEIHDPEHQLLSKAPDSSKLSHIVWGSDVSGSCYADDTGDYLFLQTSEYFPVWSYSQLDNILLEGVTFTSNTYQAVGSVFREWIQRPGGHVVVGTAYGLYESSDGASKIILTDGANDCGYANWIIIRNRFNDPVDGNCELAYFTGAPGTEEPAFAAEVRDYPVGYQEGGILNLSRQVQLALRVITRDYDSASNLRPDNV